MPTKRPRKHFLPDNLEPALPPRECLIVHTAERLRTKRPEAYAGIAADLAAGASVIQIKRRWRVHHNTIAVVSRREVGTISAQREVIKGLTAIAAQATLEKFLERFEANAIPDGVLPIACGIFLDKVARDSGEATQTIEVKKTISLEQVQEELAEMRKAEPVEIQAERIEEKVEVEPEDSGPA